MPKISVLFLCTGNSCRSIMAEALLRERGGDHFEAYSAGTQPKGVNPLTAKVLQEIGIDAAALRSKHVSEIAGKIPLDYVIAVCHSADESCPGALSCVGERLFWPFEDPPALVGTDDERLAKFREVRDQIVAKIKDWIAELKTA